MSTALEPNTVQTPLELATLGGGCFWCLETVFNRLQGVELAESGYSGGKRPNPTYEQVCTGVSGHVEVVRVRFNPSMISFEALLDVFFKLHDPTTLNRQGNDEGTQYRSVIFYHDERQAEIAKRVIADLEERKVFNSAIVTAVEPLQNYYPAEPYHQGYFEANPRQSYCAYVVAPKVEKAKQLFGQKFK
jgi:peptide-methionine (S)-S-oxide reductase